MRIPVLVGACLLAVVGCLSGATARGDEPLTVALQSGRTFTGLVDERTDGRRLWLRFGDAQTNIVRPLAWESILAAWRGADRIPLDELQQTAAARKPPAAVDEKPAADLEGKPADGTDEAAPPADAELAAPPADAELLPAPRENPLPKIWLPPPRVATVDFEAYLTNWDADADPDGLTLLVRPLDKWGSPIAAEGAVYVELRGLVRRDFSAAPRSGGVALQTLDRWGKTLAMALPTGEGYWLKLPFAAEPPNPEFVASRGIVHVRLVVPGHGVFEAVRDGVPILPFAPTPASRPGFLTNSSGR